MFREEFLRTVLRGRTKSNDVLAARRTRTLPQPRPMRGSISQSQAVLAGRWQNDAWHGRHGRHGRHGVHGHGWHGPALIKHHYHLACLQQHDPRSCLNASVSPCTPNTDPTFPMHAHIVQLARSVATTSVNPFALPPRVRFSRTYAMGTTGTLAREV